MDEVCKENEVHWQGNIESCMEFLYKLSTVTFLPMQEGCPRELGVVHGGGS